MRPRRLALVLVAFFLSGSLGLIDEVIWIRRAALVFGSTTQAVATVLAAFFFGLAAGSAVAARHAARLHAPLRAYAWLEAGIGICACLSPLAFGLGDRLFGAWYPSLWDRPVMLAAVRFALVSCVVAPPAALMGATLPLLARGLVRRDDRVGRDVGLLYAWNTLGAAAGAALCGWFLVPRLGMDATLIASGAMNLAIAAAVWIARPDRDATTEPRVGVAPAGAPGAERSRAVLGPIALPVGVLFFLTGFVALAHEVLWTRFLSLLVHNTVYTYTLTLALVLVGIVIGSAVVARFGDRWRRPALWFGAAQALNAIVSLGLVLRPADAWTRLTDRLAGADPIVVFALLILPSAVLSGALVPIAVRMVATRSEQAATAVGWLVGLNTLGGIAGSLLVGFLVLPALGLQRSFVLVTGLGLCSAIAAWLWLEHGKLRWALAAAAAIGFAAIPWASTTRLPQDLLAARGELVAFREGRASHLAVVRHQGVLQLEIDRWWQGERRKTHQIMAAHVPMLFVEAPRRILVVGIGSGLTSSRFLRYDIERLDAVDVEPALPGLLRQYFDADWLRDPRARVVVEDGQNWIRHARERYDVVSIEVGQIVRPGIASFYTADFYRRARARLAPGGVVAQFVPLPPLTEPEMATVLRSFIEVFPHAALWYNTSELLLIGRADEPLRIGPAALDRVEHREAVREDLEWSHWGGPRYRLDRPVNLLGGFLAGERGLRALAARGEIARDERPRLEYALAGRAGGDDSPLALRIGAELDPVDDLGVPAALLAARDSIDAVRRANLRAIGAESRLRIARALQDAGRGEEAVALLREAVVFAPEHVGCRRLLGEALASQGNSEGLSWLTGAQAMDSTDIRVRQALGFQLHQAGRLEEAGVEYRAALRLDPEDAEAHNNLGAACAQLGALEEAREHFAAAVEIDPRYVSAQHNLANALAALGRLDEALSAYRRAIELEPRDPQTWFHMGLAQAARGDWGGATASQRRSLALDPGYAPARAALDQALQRRR